MIPPSCRRQSLTVPRSLFDRDTADNLINIYFSTIHIAYPFIDRRRFLEDYEKYWDNERRESLPSVSIALLCKLCVLDWINVYTNS